MKFSSLAPLLLLVATTVSEQSHAAVNEGTGFIQQAHRIIQSDSLDVLQSAVRLELLSDGSGSFLFQPWSQTPQVVQVHRDVCRSFGRIPAMDVSVTLGPDVDFAFPCESAIRPVQAAPRTQPCHASATMSGPGAVIQGVQDIFEGEALLEKDGRWGSVSGSLAVTVAGLCATTIHAEVIGGAGASRSLHLPIGCTLPSPGLFNSAATAAICEESDVSTHSFTVIPGTP